MSEPVITIENFDFFYGASQALYGIGMTVPDKQVEVAKRPPPRL